MATTIIIFNKPWGVLCAFTDPEGRETLKDYIPVNDVYPIGRLDYDSEGMLLLTNNGKLAHKLTSPNHKINKTYLVQIEGLMTPEALTSLKSGIIIKGKKTQRCQAMVIPEPILEPRRKPITPHGPTQWLRVVLREGRKRQIRHMTAAVGFPTLRIVRVAIGPLWMEGLNQGDWRELTKEEIDRLQQAIKDPV